MADAATIESRHQGLARVLCVRLAGSMSHTIPMSEWALRDCPSLRVQEMGKKRPDDVTWTGHDYVLLLAVSTDGVEARQWVEAAQSAGVGKVMVSLFKTGQGDLRDFGKNWDALFVSRGVSLTTPLLLFLEDRLVGYDDADLWSMLSNRIAVMHSIGQNGVLPDDVLDHAVGLVTHFTMEGCSEGNPHPPTLREIDERYTALRSRLPNEADSLLSVGNSCRAASDLIIFRIADWSSLS